MSTALLILGVILNIFLAGVGFILAPKGAKTRGIMWFGVYLLGSLAIGALFPEQKLLGIYYIFLVNVASSFDFYKLSKHDIKVQ